MKTILIHLFVDFLETNKNKCNDETIQRIILDNFIEDHNSKFPKDKLKYKLEAYDIPCFEEKQFDLLLFDWGGMSMGNSMMEHLCNYLIKHAKDNPSRHYVMISDMTSWAMKDALEVFEDDFSLPNIHLDEKQFFKDILEKRILL